MCPNVQGRDAGSPFKVFHNSANCNAIAMNLRNLRLTTVALFDFLLPLFESLYHPDQHCHHHDFATIAPV